MSLRLYTLLTFLLLVAVSLHAIEREHQVVKFYYLDEAPASEIALADISRITLTSVGLNIESLNSENIAFIGYDNLKKITFDRSSSPALSVLENELPNIPTVTVVGDMLVVNGAESLLGSTISIYSAIGQNMIDIPSWNGESVNLSTLPLGIYIVKIKSETFKIIKR